MESLDVLRAQEQANSVKGGFFQYCYMNTVIVDKKHTAQGSYVIHNDGTEIFAITIDLIKKEIVEITHNFTAEQEELKRAFETHFDLEFVYSDVLVLSAEALLDMESYVEAETLQIDEKYGRQVFYSDLEELSVNDTNIEL